VYENPGEQGHIMTGQCPAGMSDGNWRQKARILGPNRSVSCIFQTPQAFHAIQTVPNCVSHWAAVSRLLANRLLCAYRPFNPRCRPAGQKTLI
jgi:hypothetical protein